jgi:hypothetical protein
MKIGGYDNTPSTNATIMVSLQHALVRHSSSTEGAEDQISTFKFHQPCMVLPGASAAVMHTAFASWNLFTSAGVGKCLEYLKFDTQLLDRVPWQLLVLMGDALKANDAMFKKERKAIAKHNKNENKTTVKLGLQLKCGIHQACLIRRPIIYSFPGFWGG